MSGTKRTKRAPAPPDGGDGAARPGSSARVVPVAVDAYEDDDGFLGEIVGPATPVRDAVSEPVLDELNPEGPPEDLLGALAETQDASHDDLDDILDDIVSPAASALESGPGERSRIIPDEGMRDASEAFAPAETDAPAGSTVATPSADHQPTDKPASVSKPYKLTGRLLPRLSGTAKSRAGLMRAGWR